MQKEKLKVLFTSQQATFNHSHSKTEQSFLSLLHCDASLKLAEEKICFLL